MKLHRKVLVRSSEYRAVAVWWGRGGCIYSGDICLEESDGLDAMNVRRWRRIEDPARRDACARRCFAKLANTKLRR